MRTEIVADIEGGSGRPVLHIGIEIPARSTANSEVSTRNATDESRSENNDDYSFHRQHRPHFPTNKTEKAQKSKRKIKVNFIATIQRHDLIE
jgi:hypothetical protein